MDPTEMDTEMEMGINPFKAKSPNRHRSSLEGMMILPAGTPALLPDDTRAQAKARLYHILENLEAPAGAAAASNQRPRQGYNRPALVRLTYEYTISDQSKSLFLTSFFESLALPLDGNVTDADIDFENTEVAAGLGTSVDAFAEYLMNNFFLPLKAASNKTPQPSPITHSAIQRAQGSSLPQSFVGTPDRVSALRGLCLVRDHHCCVISRKFDITEARKRLKAATRDPALDDDGLPLSSHEFAHLEVAHILPHSLAKSSSNSLLDPARKAALDVLNMFDPGVVHLIEGAEIDRPYNAISLTQHLHSEFGSFQIFFEPVDSRPPHTYRINGFDPLVDQTQGLPVIRTLHLAQDKTIDPPSSRLLAIHRAIAHILHLSGAGDYIDWVLRDAEENGVRSDGSTALGLLVSARLSLGGIGAGA
ncbi:hypothetical protein GGTG_04628 [Gaeumannomyces tritici R3-111a-1]|uniref:HNH nuclease domain-containing protein n=1 Tax=Gaeumannomyces tritici (strain R3-111a-1) TaxID=644352 RepID=J3NTM8_GAET3|nr:hypothetical protein GGTG_04628 [Gaeumannomyces tritici R3-111a-1]EJT79543.1 hypothetical protein GGTG_04628 [Gaeumannomyces tritici R3-111a-1]